MAPPPPPTTAGACGDDRRPSSGAPHPAADRDSGYCCPTGCHASPTPGASPYGASSSGSASPRSATASSSCPPTPAPANTSTGSLRRSPASEAPPPCGSPSPAQQSRKAISPGAWPTPAPPNNSTSWPRPKPPASSAPRSAGEHRAYSAPNCAASTAATTTPQPPAAWPKPASTPCTHPASVPRRSHEMGHPHRRPQARLIHRFTGPAQSSRRRNPAGAAPNPATTTATAASRPSCDAALKRIAEIVHTKPSNTKGTAP